MNRLAATMPHSFAQQKGSMKFGGKDPIEILDDIKFHMEFRLLSNVKGVYVNPENCSALSATENPLDLDEVDVDRKS